MSAVDHEEVRRLCDNAQRLLGLNTLETALAAIQHCRALLAENEALSRDRNEVRDCYRVGVEERDALRKENAALRARKARVCKCCEGRGGDCHKDCGGDDDNCGPCRGFGAVLVDNPEVNVRKETP